MSIIKRNKKSGFLPDPGKRFEEHHLVALVNYAAYVVVRYGDVYTPLFEKFEKDLVELRLKRSPTDRARALLETQAIDLQALPTR